MGRKMSRGKQQVLFNYLPGKTFDFERVATIAQVTAIRGSLRNDLNRIILLRKVKENASAWDENLRPALSDETLDDPERFVLLDPKGVQAEMFPKCSGARIDNVAGYLIIASATDCLKRNALNVAADSLYNCVL